MEKDKSVAPGGGGAPSDCLPPHSSRYAAFGNPTGSLGFMTDLSASSSAKPPPDAGSFGHAKPVDSGQFSYDLSQMPDFPTRNTGHRRAHSEIVSFPDDISFDSDLGVVGSHDGPSLSDETEEDLVSMYMDVEKLNSGASSVGLSAAESSQVSLPNVQAPPESERPRIRHQHSKSLDGSTMKQELVGPSSIEAKKALPAAKLADLALVDPKRAKRILANRQSAARSKERKLRYIAELELKVKTLQAEATTLNVQLTMLQRDTGGLTAENKELKLQLQTLEQQIHLQDALNDALRKEVQRLKLATGQMLPNAGQMMNFVPPSFGGNQQFYPHNQAMQPIMPAHQLQQLQIHSQQPHPNQHQGQQQMHPRPQQQQPVQHLQPHPNQHQGQQQMPARPQQQQPLLHLQPHPNQHQGQQQMHPRPRQQQQQQPVHADLRMKGPLYPENHPGDTKPDDKNT